MPTSSSFTRPFLSILFTLVANTTITSAQEIVQGQIQSTDSATHTVIRIYPDTFPWVNVIFRAQSPGGGPMWSIDKSNVLATENGKSCAVISVRKLSEGQRVNTALVIDHSGSMMENPPYKVWLDSVLRSPGVWQTMTMREYTKGKKDSDSLVKVCVLPPCPDHLLPAIFHAKRAARAYIAGLDTSKDAVSVIGFSDRVQEKVSLSLDYARGDQTVQKMYAQGGTAFYDGVYAGLEETAKGVGIKAVVALTDGQDNSSKHTLDEVIAKAKELGIPVYCVGLGAANRAVLERISQETGGTAYFTEDPAALTNIYAMISGEIMSIYEMVYVSDAIMSANETRDVHLQFEIPVKYTLTDAFDAAVLPEVVARIEEQDVIVSQQDADGEISTVMPANATPEEKTNWPLAAGIAVALLGTGVIGARYIKKTNEEKVKGAFEIVQVYPSPTTGPLTVIVNTDVSGMPGRVIVRDISGREVFTVPFLYGSAIDTDLSGLGSGTYFVSVQAGGNVTGGQAVIVY